MCTYVCAHQGISATAKSSRHTGRWNHWTALHLGSTELEFCCRRWALLQGFYVCLCVCGWKLFFTTSVPPRVGGFVFIPSWEDCWTCILIPFTIPASKAATIYTPRHACAPQRLTPQRLQMDGFRIAQAFMFATQSRLKEPVSDVVCAAITVAHFASDFSPPHLFYAS